jgi:DNA polymerase III delta subunit
MADFTRSTTAALKYCSGNIKTLKNNDRQHGLAFIHFFTHMIHIIHGDDIEASRKELNTLRSRSLQQEVVQIDGKTTTLTELTQATESGSLFGSNRVVIIENLLSKRLGKTVAKADTETISAWIKQLPIDLELIFWEEKEIGKTILGLFPKNVDTALYKTDRPVFAFVESVKPGANKELLLKLDTVLIQESAEMVFAMLVRQFRLLIMAKDLDKLSLGLSPWQAAKLVKQAQYFTVPQLLSLYEQLLAIDVTIKTGTGPFILKKELELFFVNI